MAFVSRGFARRRRSDAAGRLPPGQHDAGAEFTVLSAGPTPSTRLDTWDFTVRGEIDTPRRWSWADSVRCHVSRSPSTSTA